MKTQTRAALAAENAELRERLAALSFAQPLRPFSPLAWMGGSSPIKPSQTPRPQAAYRRALFREQVNTHSAFWHLPPEWDTLRTFFHRAHSDAFATFRGAFNA
jgi:hypothetical protein